MRYEPFPAGLPRALGYDIDILREWCLIRIIKYWNWCWCTQIDSTQIKQYQYTYEKLRDRHSCEVLAANGLVKRTLASEVASQSDCCIIMVW